jgi:hypothetical protein
MSRDPNKAPFSKTPGSLGCFTLKMELQIAFLPYNHEFCDKSCFRSTLKMAIELQIAFLPYNSCAKMTTTGA